MNKEQISVFEFTGRRKVFAIGINEKLRNIGNVASTIDLNKFFKLFEKRRKFMLTREMIDAILSKSLSHTTLICTGCEVDSERIGAINKTN